MFKIGLGQDSHPFSKNKNRPLILGGVKISDTDGLEGNSDADCILHSLCNGLSSAIGGDSLGTWADAMHEKGITDSKVYLEHILNKVKENKFEIENVSISVEAKKPYLEDEQIKLIKSQMAKILNINIDQIGITFTSGEGLTAFGRGEGIQAFSIVLLKLSHLE